ncbi:MAG: hypothetical protein HZB36_08455 [Candidatus Omnitrophica bacterium]|nr:hypothetical protein [Candidatus Omnitrophota bacterium]
MGNGGFLVRFLGTKENAQCYKVALDYDEWKYRVNEEEPKEFPDGIKGISIEIEEE